MATKFAKQIAKEMKAAGIEGIKLSRGNNGSIQVPKSQKEKIDKWFDDKEEQKNKICPYEGEQCSSITGKGKPCRCQRTTPRRMF